MRGNRTMRAHVGIHSTCKTDYRNPPAVPLSHNCLSVQWKLRTRMTGAPTKTNSITCNCLDPPDSHSSWPVCSIPHQESIREQCNPHSCPENQYNGSETKGTRHCSSATFANNFLFWGRSITWTIHSVETRIQRKA